MTTLDRAFIKAFTDEPHTSGADMPGAGPHAVHDSPVPEPAVAIATVPADEAEPAPPASRKSPPRPLSSFSAQPKVHDSCQALLEVDRLDWPAACRDLLAGASQAWEHFTEQLVAQMSQGHKCVALSGVARGAGRTTVALAAAGTWPTADCGRWWSMPISNTRRWSAAAASRCKPAGTI